LVVSFDEDGDRVAGRVKATWKHRYMPLYELDGIEVSAEQPFQQPDGSYKRTMEIRPVTACYGRMAHPR
jgi:hypothetical protein